MESKVIGPLRAHLWLVEPGRVRDASRLVEYESWLTPDERRKADAFVYPRHRHEYIVTRALERTALSTYLGVSPGSLRFVRDERGRPRLSPDRGLRYSLSNTLQLVACLTSDSHEVGVDTEPLSRADEILEVSSSVFAQQERAGLARLSPTKANRRLVELWTLKESYIKALGKGMELPLDKFWFDLDHDDPPRLVLGLEVADDASRWAFTLVELGENLVAVCIGSGSSTRPTIERFEPAL